MVATVNSVGSVGFEYTYHTKVVGNRLQMHLSLAVPGSGIEATGVVKASNSFKEKLNITEEDIDLLLEGDSALENLPKIQEDLAGGFGVNPEQIYLKEHGCSQGCSGCGNRSACRDSTLLEGEKNLDSSPLPTVEKEESSPFPTVENEKDNLESSPFLTTLEGQESMEEFTIIPLDTNWGNSHQKMLNSIGNFIDLNRSVLNDQENALSYVTEEIASGLS